MKNHKIAIRWTIGDVSARGFEALRLSILGARKIFGSHAHYVVCVNTIPISCAREHLGDVAARVTWHDATRDIPSFLSDILDEKLAEGAAWKFAPLRMFPDHHELLLDNDCILWDLPHSMRWWLDHGKPMQCLMAEDVKACFGQFADLCPPVPRNAGIRGLPPNFNFEAALRDALREARVSRIGTETDEQGLQTAALSLHADALAVTLKEVTICSPFHPHLPHLGHCGAHFVGLNASHIPWKYFDRPADEVMAKHWTRHHAQLLGKVQANIPAQLDHGRTSCVPS